MRNPWVIAQLAVAAVLLIVSVSGWFPASTFGLPILGLVGNIQAIGVFPGLVISLVLNALVMGRGTNLPRPSTALRALLIVEFVVIAALLVFHFSPDPAGDFLGIAILSWPLVITLAVVILVVALVRRGGRTQSPPQPTPQTPPPVA